MKTIKQLKRNKFARFGASFLLCGVSGDASSTSQTQNALNASEITERKTTQGLGLVVLHF